MERRESAMFMTLLCLYVLGHVKRVDAGVSCAEHGSKYEDGVERGGDAFSLPRLLLYHLEDLKVVCALVPCAAYVCA